MSRTPADPSDPLEPTVFLRGCLLTAGWAVATIAYLFLASWLTGRVGRYATGWFLIAAAAVPVAYALGKPPFLRWPLRRRWPGTEIDDPDDPDPSAGQGYWLAAAVVLVLAGMLVLLGARPAAR